MSEPPIVPDEDPGPVILGWNDAPVSGDRVDVHQGPLIAGDPVGARVEVTGDGVHAYDATGTETAHIRGEGGEFVGGSFRTSDALPGQVTLSDTANAGTPGLSVEPEDSTGYDVLPSIGPGPDDMHISGGVSTDGTMSGAQFGAAGTSIYHNGPGANGTGSWALVNGDEARLAYRDDRTSVSRESGVWVRPTGAALFTEGDDGYGSISASSTAASISASSVAGDASSDVARIRVNLEDAMLSMRKQGGRTRRLRVDENGVWAEIETGPNTWLYDSYNLLETASDSGWQPITPAPGFTALSEGFHVRQLGRMIYLRGAATGNVTTNWVTIGTIPAEFRPPVRQINSGASSTITNMMFQTGTNGELQVKGNNTGTGLNIYVNTILYPID